MTQLIRQVRTCFNQLRTLAENLAADLDVNPSVRAIIESLSQRGPCTVPDLAQERGTSRQHVQTVINALLDQGHVRREDNPEHKRSLLYMLTTQGEEVFSEIQRREKAPMRELTAALEQADIAAAGEVLARLNLELECIINKGEPNDGI
ncbi:MAG: DNA-binding MarR family transcriptional regulator [Halocynthiibacter sp.]|jgi:DNA-binding MarR family transcriptional regulator